MYCLFWSICIYGYHSYFKYCCLFFMYTSMFPLFMFRYNWILLNYWLQDIRPNYQVYSSLGRQHVNSWFYFDISVTTNLFLEVLQLLQYNNNFNGVTCYLEHWCDTVIGTYNNTHVQHECSNKYEHTHRIHSWCGCSSGQQWTGGLKATTCSPSLSLCHCRRLVLRRTSAIFKAKRHLRF